MVVSAKICGKNLRKFAGKLSFTLSKLKVRKHFPQIGADQERR